MSKIEDCVHYYGRTLVGENSEVVDIHEVREEGVTHVEIGELSEKDGKVTMHTKVIKRPEYVYSGTIYMVNPRILVDGNESRREYRIDIKSETYPTDLQAYQSETKKEILTRLASLIAFDFSITT